MSFEVHKILSRKPDLPPAELPDVYNRFFEKDSDQHQLNLLLNDINAEASWLEELDDVQIPQVQSIVKEYKVGNLKEAREKMKKLLN